MAGAWSTYVVKDNGIVCDERLRIYCICYAQPEINIKSLFFLLSHFLSTFEIGRGILNLFVNNSVENLSCYICPA